MTITDIATLQLIKFTDTNKIDSTFSKDNLLFLAPEVKESDFDDVNLTSKADIWSLGAILYLIINRRFEFIQQDLSKSPMLNRNSSSM